ncbi:histidine kinase [Novosphingobium sp. FSY-8]|uniref:Histidine kinase n=1 Tax=Novosphingobium ovatum TaxID=1908523 RepID=A0ABW9XF62_9SPHN|nr:histidine kinase [Novosphingobium ovatum]NBC37185.1 histidine kinase [Novosphingobium ovatum]
MRPQPLPTLASAIRPRRIPSGVVLAAMRVVMALLFVAWLDLASPRSMPGQHAAVALFAAYLLFAVGMVVVAWSSWWHDHRLAGPAFAIDAMTALVGLYWTRAVTLDFFSAFLTLFAFLVLTAAARWSRRGMLLVMLGLAACFLLAGWLVDGHGTGFDMPKFIRRFSTLMVLLMMLGWFALNTRGLATPRHHRHGGAADDEQATPDTLNAALAYAMDLCGATGGALAWLPMGETRAQLCTVGLANPPAWLEHEALRIDDADGGLPFLFDGARRMALRDDNRRGVLAQAAPCALAAALGVTEGLAIPLITRTGRGQVLLWSMARPNGDDLLAAQGMAREIALALDEEETETLAREVAMSRLRSQIAADLHDSVVQTLAGARYRLQALRADAGDDASAQIDQITSAIAAEQQHLRAIIGQLRLGRIQPGQRDLHHEAITLAEHLSSQWAAQVWVAPHWPAVIGPAALNFAMQQIIREGTANAVRHGKASAVAIAIEPTGDGLRLSITDNGDGFLPGALPRSIAQRVAALGGQITVISRPGHSSVDITLPMEPHA